MSVGLLNLQYNLLGMNRYLANAIAIGIVTMWNFWLNTRFSWRVTGARIKERKLPLASSLPAVTASAKLDLPAR